MTFEQYFAEWLGTYLQQDIAVKLEPQKISAIISDYDNSRVFLIETGITVTCTFEKKLDAATWDNAVTGAAKAFANENWISRVFVEGKSATPKGLLSKWEYTTVFNILHKARSSW